MNSHEVRQRWAERSGEYSPDYYAHYGPDETSESIRARLDAVVGPDAAVLELGCSSGRHLAHLHEHGYENLHGIDINDDALDVMRDEYPGLAADGTFYVDAIENAVPDFADGRFDAVFSVETLQHIHPDDAWVFAELHRITSELLVTVENEGDESDRATDSTAETTDSATDSTAETTDPDDPAVNYVDDGVPLYYRDWNRVFAERGFTEVDAESAKRDTLRAFRPA